MPQIKDMLVKQIKERGISNQDILDAMMKYPRELFVDDALKDRAYDDSPLPIGFGQTISQPYIVAFMLELLELEKKHDVLEIGAGSGYQAALLSSLVNSVIALELIPKLGQQAQQRCEDLGIKNLKIRISDGYQGWPKNAPYDRIIVAAAAEAIPQQLLAQLKPEGILVIPIGKQMKTQELQIIRKDCDGNIQMSKSLDVRFVPLVKPKYK
ncbi:MAG: protein-L-isoaspartate(D-aspartate) O-methyltransferase [Pseudomonadota bacterium]|nr:protein-L-isoaspartate(D-aspartate) O-methyltransferase [Pseudomonadota bacterium]